MTIICPACQRATSTGAISCVACGWTFQHASSGPAVVRPAPRPKIPCDVLLAATVDRTGSSKRFCEGIPTTFATICRQIDAKARSLTVCLQSHGDLDLDEEFVLHTDRGTSAQAIDDVRRISYGGGGDPPEHHLDAIEHLLRTTAWPADPTSGRGAILAFTTADTKPSRSGLSARDLGAEIRKREILLYLVSEPTPSLQELVSAASGIIFTITNDPDPTELQKISAQLAASILVTVASRSTEPMPVAATT